MIRGVSGLEFLFINARAHSIGKALNIVSCGNAHGSFDVWSLIKRQASGWPVWPSAEIMPFLAWFLPVDARPRTQPVQGGFVAAIDTEPVVADGRTCLKLPFCHWKMKAAAAPFSPSASNFTGPCTLVSGTPLCR